MVESQAGHSRSSVSSPWPCPSFWSLRSFCCSGRTCPVSSIDVRKPQGLPSSPRVLKCWLILTNKICPCRRDLKNTIKGCHLSSWWQPLLFHFRPLWTPPISSEFVWAPLCWGGTPRSPGLGGGAAHWALLNHYSGVPMALAPAMYSLFFCCPPYCLPQVGVFCFNNCTHFPFIF